MNYLNRFFCLGALLVTPALFAADTFVGRISLALTEGKGKTMVMKQAMNGKATRMEVEGMPGATIMDFAKKEMIMLMNDDHMYMVMPLRLDQTAHESPAKTPAADPEIVVTGKTETILGYRCKQVMVTEGKKVTEMWLAEELGQFAGMGGSGGGMMGRKKGNAESAKWEKALKGVGGFPLRVITRDASGKESFKMEATKIEKGGVTDADFLPPKDFQKFEMPDMGGMNPFK